MKPIKAGHYTSNAELGELIKTYQVVKRRMKPSRLARLVEILSLISGGAWDRWQPTASREDFIQECQFIYFSKALLKCDPTRNVFAYMTTCAKNHGDKLRTAEIRERSAERVFGLDYIDRQTDAAERAAGNDDPDPPEAPACDPSSPSSPPPSSPPSAGRRSLKRVDRPPQRARGRSAISPRRSISATPAD